MPERPRASTAAAVLTAAAVEAVEAALVAALLTAAAVLAVGMAAAKVIDRLATSSSGAAPSYGKVSHLCWWPSHVCVTLAVNMEASSLFHACHAVQS